MAYGFVVGLDYSNPWLSPFEEMQRFKTHPHMRKHFEGGRRISYGARALVEGGMQSLPKLSFPGGVLLGDAAGFLNVPKIKGTHTAMKSGMLAAEALAEALAGGQARRSRPATRQRLRAKLGLARNCRTCATCARPSPNSAAGAASPMPRSTRCCCAARRPGPCVIRMPTTRRCRTPTRRRRITYPKPDGVLTFDRLSSVFISNTNHEENQPAHLQLAEPAKAIEVNWNRYRSPETRYCPAQVYEIVGAEEGTPRLQINAQNCVHCKTCDIKDPTQNINWVPPEGGGGPSYPGGM